MHRPYGTHKLDFIPFYPAVIGSTPLTNHGWQYYGSSLCDCKGNETQGNYFVQNNAVGMTDDLASQFIGWIKG
jgi:hypothetical protein